MTRVRTGRRNGHTLYLQAGPDPTDTDLYLGAATTPVAAQWLADAANCGIGHHPGLMVELTHALLDASAKSLGENAQRLLDASQAHRDQLAALTGDAAPRRSANSSDDQP